MDKSSLDSAKQRVLQAIGQHGIHGVGARQTENVVTVYATPDEGAQTPEVQRNLEQLAAPFPVRVIFDEPPKATPAPN